MTFPPEIFWTLLIFAGVASAALSFIATARWIGRSSDSTVSVFHLTLFATAIALGTVAFHDHSKDITGLLPHSMSGPTGFSIPALLILGIALFLAVLILCGLSYGITLLVVLGYGLTKSVPVAGFLSGSTLKSFDVEVSAPLSRTAQTTIETRDQLVQLNVLAMKEFSETKALLVPLNSAIERVLLAVQDGHRLTREEHWRRAAQLDELVGAALVQRFGSDTFRDLILPSKVPYSDVTVRYTLRNHAPLPGVFRLRYELAFTAAIEEVVIAVTEDPILQQYIAERCDRVSYVIVPSEQRDLDAFADAMCDASKSFVLITTTSMSPGSSTPKRSFHRISTSHFQQFAPGIDRGSYPSLRIVCADASIGGAGPRRIELQAAPLELKHSYEYAYWIADRPMYLTKVIFDVSDFLPLATTDYSIHPFFPTGPDVIQRTKDSSGILGIHVNNWVLCGHGVMLRWKSH